MMLHDLIKATEKELVMGNDLSLEINRSHALFNKYYKIKYDCEKKLADEKHKLDKIVKFRTDYYLGKCTPEVYKQEPFGHKVLKSDVERYISADDQVHEQKQKIKELFSCVEYLDNILQKHINARQYTVKTKMDYMKFAAGG